MAKPVAVYSLFVFGVLVLLLQVLLPAYFVTGDGPCHVYNARILHDIWGGHHVAFYTHYYRMVELPHPNWLTHLLLAGLLYVASGPVAEKILISSYVLLFCWSFFSLLRRLEGSRSSLWPAVAVVFAAHHLLIKGFYNFSFSIALFFVLLRLWLSFLDRPRWYKLLGVSLASLATYFCHPLAFALGASACLALTLSHVFSGSYGQGRRRILMNMLAQCLLALLPAGLFFLKFAMDSTTPTAMVWNWRELRIMSLLKATCLLNYQVRELVWTAAIGGGLVVVTAYTLCRYIIYTRRIGMYDGLWLCLLVALLGYRFLPDTLLGGGSLVPRFQLFVYLFAACAIAACLQQVRIKNIAALLIMGCFMVLGSMRISTINKASGAVEELVEAGKYIPNLSTVLPMNFSPGGSDGAGGELADGNWLFTHPWHYIGAQKPLIFLDNYEANTGYFPFTWQTGMGPYSVLHLEETPPYGDIQGFEAQSGARIGYVLSWCYDSNYRNDARFSAYFAYVQQHFRPVYQSVTGRVVVYRRNE